MTVSAGTIEEPERGTWVADVESRDEASGKLSFGGVEWTGRVAYSTRENGRTKARVVGGVGDLGVTLPDKWYLGGGSGDTIVGDIARGVGLPVESDLPQRVASWQRARASAGECLDQICDALGAQWWVGRDGVLRTGARESSVIQARTEGTGSDGITVLAPESSAGVAPGRTYPDGGVIRHARHILRGETLRVEASATALRTREPSGLGYLRMHRGVVERQHADGSLDLIVDNTHSLTRIPWLPGVPAVCVLEPGDVVMVASWSGGNPRQWAAVGVSRTEGGTATAGIGDTADCGTLILSHVPGVPPGSTTIPAGDYIPPGPDHDAQAAAIRAARSIPPSVIHLDARLEAVITSGNPRILAGGGGG